MSWTDAMYMRYEPEHQQEVAQAKEEGRWVEGPYASAEIAARIRELGGKPDHITDGWIMPEAQHVPEITALLQAWRQETELAAEAKRIAQEAAEQAERQAAEARQQRIAERLIAKSGRTPTGETTGWTEYSTDYMNRAEAMADAHKLGSVITLDDGRTGVIIGVDVWFTNRQTAEEEGYNPVTGYDAHWTWRYEAAIVRDSANA